MNRYLSIGIVSAISVVIGFAWYTSLGSIWAESAGIEMDENGPIMLPLIGEFLRCCVYSWALSFLIQQLRVQTMLDALKMGLVTWVGFVFASQVSGVIWAAKPMAMFMIDVGCLLLISTVASALLFVWRTDEVEATA